MLQVFANVFLQLLMQAYMITNTGKNIAHISPIDVHDCHFFASNNSSMVKYVIRHEHTTIL